MNIYSYTSVKTQGPNGTTITFTAPTDDANQAIPLGTHSNREYVGFADGTVIPQQPTEIGWQAEPDALPILHASDWYRLQLAHLANIRWMRVASGTVWNGLPVQTGPIDQSNIMGLYVAAKDGVRADNSMFKFADGIARPLSNADAVAMAEQVFARTQTCFDREAELAELLRDGQMPDLSEGWPE